MDVRLNSSSTRIIDAHEKSIRQKWFGYTNTIDQIAKDTLDAAVERIREDLVPGSSPAKVFVPWKLHPKDGLPEPQLVDGKTFITQIEIYFCLPTSLQPQQQESYELKISPEGQVFISVFYPLGGLHALSTFRQLFYRHSDERHALTPYTPYAPLAITDAPIFEHRGLNLDISRNIITPADVMRTIEGLSMNKFNRLHLHASDAQSWPLEIPALPELANRGSYHKDHIWSVADLNKVQEYGGQRGIQVYLEIDMPGHTASIHAAYPELIQSYNRQPWPNYSAQPCAGQLKLSNSAVTEFVDTLLGDLLPRTEYYSSLFHLGGDEVDANAYDMSASELRPYLQAFVNHAISKVHSYFLTPVVWEEHLLDYNLTLPNDTIVQVWRGGAADKPSPLALVVNRGHKALFGPNTHWYLDCGHGDWRDPDLQNPESPVKPPYLDYCAPLKNWKQIYSYDPLADIPQDQQHLVIGGEVHMWGEQTDGMNLDSNLWPRVAAAGEILWRGKGTVSEDVTRRLAEMREWVVAKGLAAAPVTPTWCLMHPGNCRQ